MEIQDTYEELQLTTGFMQAAPMFVQMTAGYMKVNAAVLHTHKLWWTKYVVLLLLYKIHSSRHLLKYTAILSSTSLPHLGRPLDCRT